MCSLHSTISFPSHFLLYWHVYSCRGCIMLELFSRYRLLQKGIVTSFFPWTRIGGDFSESFYHHAFIFSEFVPFAFYSHWVDQISCHSNTIEKISSLSSHTLSLQYSEIRNHWIMNFLTNSGIIIPYFSPFIWDYCNKYRRETNIEIGIIYNS